MSEALDVVGMVLLAAVVVAGASIIWHGLTVGIAPMPTSPAVKRALFALAPPAHEVSGEVHELGAGWGTLVFTLCERYPTCPVVAWESSPVPFAVLWLRQRVARMPNLRLRFEDFARADLAPAGLVTCYLHPAAMSLLKGKFEAELRPGAVILTQTFALRGWNPEARLTVEDLYRTPVYRYRSPAAADRMTHTPAAQHTPGSSLD